MRLAGAAAQPHDRARDAKQQGRDAALARVAELEAAAASAGAKAKK